MPIKPLSPYLLFAALLLGQPLVATAQGAHVHGRASLEVVQDGQRLSIRFDSPLDSLTGFERAPRTDQERKALEKAAATLREPARLFGLPAAAGCTPGGVELTSRALAAVDGASKHTTAKHEAHGDMEAGYAFSCTNPEALDSIEVRLFKVFPRIKMIDLAFSGAKGQKAARLTAKQARFDW